MNLGDLPLQVWSDEVIATALKRDALTEATRDVLQATIELHEQHPQLTPT